MAQFDRAQTEDYDCIGLIDLSTEDEVVTEIGLNSDQTHLLVLTVIIEENGEKSFLRVYDLQTLDFNVANSDQVFLTPHYLSRLQRLHSPSSASSGCHS